jgi:prefoldin subunit 5
MAPEFGPPIPPEEEKQMLQEQVAFLERQLDAITKRIEELQKESKEKS